MRRFHLLSTHRGLRERERDTPSLGLLAETLKVSRKRIYSPFRHFHFIKRIWQQDGALRPSLTPLSSSFSLNYSRLFASAHVLTVIHTSQKWRLVVMSKSFAPPARSLSLSLSFMFFFLDPHGWPRSSTETYTRSRLRYFFVRQNKAGPFFTWTGKGEIRVQKKNAQEKNELL